MAKSGFIVEGFEALFNEKHFVEAEKLQSSVCTCGSPSVRRSPSSPNGKLISVLLNEKTRI
jgi:hypothetical protein